MRKLREESPVLDQPTPPSAIASPARERAIQNNPNFNFSDLDNFKPYHEDEVLPPAVTKINRKGVRYLEKSGEPRFYFNGNEMIKVYNGLGGKKTTLYWTYKGDSAHPIRSDMSNDIRPLHKQIRAYLRKKGIPGA